jgi:hypothetical protein
VSSAAAEQMYSRHQLCADLQPSEKCFRVQQYNEGSFDLCFHEHVPSHRISQVSGLEVLRALAGQYASWTGTNILHSRLNKRHGNPSRYPVLVHHVSYPEEGVIRYSVCAGRAYAWFDAVLAPDCFRQFGNHGGETRKSRKREKGKKQVCR